MTRSQTRSILEAQKREEEKVKEEEEKARNSHLISDYYGKSFAELPPEIIGSITRDIIDGKDLTSLMRTCRYVNEAVVEEMYLRPRVKGGYRGLNVFLLRAKRAQFGRVIAMTIHIPSTRQSYKGRDNAIHAEDTYRQLIAERRIEGFPQLDILIFDDLHHIPLDFKKEEARDICRAIGILSPTSVILNVLESNSYHSGLRRLLSCLETGMNCKELWLNASFDEGTLTMRKEVSSPEEIVTVNCPGPAAAAFPRIDCHPSVHPKTINIVIHLSQSLLDPENAFEKGYFLRSLLGYVKFVEIVTEAGHIDRTSMSFPDQPHLLCESFDRLPLSSFPYLQRCSQDSCADTTIRIDHHQLRELLIRSLSGMVSTSE